MTATRSLFRFVLCVLAAILLNACASNGKRVEGAAAGPAYAVDPYWPKPLPNNWLIGQVSGIATDKNDHIWVLHRPRSLAPDELAATTKPPRAKCCFAAPPVLEFDREGNFLRGWGGAGTGYDWPKNEHGIYVDPAGNIWIGGNDPTDNMVLKFTAEGKFMMQIGSPGKSLGSNSTTQLGRPAHMELDQATNELFIVDGYQNRRVIVFDATTGVYKRHWGAFGNVPDDAKIPDHDPQSPQFGQGVHCVRLMKDQTVFVCDRANNRIQVFSKDGKFIRQIVTEPNTRNTVADLVPTQDPAQKYILVADGSNNEVRIMVRETGEVVGTIGRSGRMAGDFHSIHNIAIDSRGDIYTAEADTAKRAQRFQLVR